MSSILDAALAADEPSVVDQGSAQTAPEPTSEPAQESQPRGPDGKFAPKGQPQPAEAAPAADAAQPDAQPPQPAQAAPAPTEVPYAALIDERLKRQEIERELKAYREREAEAKAKAEADAAVQPIPDFADDPAAHLAARDEAFQEALHLQRLAILQEVAEDKYGAEKVRETVDWARERASRDEIFNRQAFASRNPIEFAMSARREEEILGQIRETGISPEELATFRAWQAAQAAGAQSQNPAAPAVPPQTAAPRPAPPPASLANQPSAGGPAHVPAGPGKAFGAVFGEA